MSDKIIHKRSLASGSIPTTSSLGIGELALNVADGKIFLHKSSSVDESIETAIVSNTTTDIGTLTLSGSLILSGSTAINSGSVFDVSADNISFDFDILSFSGSASITGSLDVSGSANIPSLTGSLFGTASYSSQALSSSFTSTASYVQNAQTASYVLNAISSSYALTASYALNGGGGGNSFPFTGSAQITGSLEVTGSVTATSFNGDGSGLTNVTSTNAASTLFNYYNFI
jgi:hypothetical protein